MDYIYIGKIVNTHGIKGEIRLLSNFDKKELIFKPNFKIYIGPNKEEKIIITYRVHRNFDMITLKGINDINEVLPFKGMNVYINRNDLNLKNDDYIIDDLLNMKIVCNNEFFGIVKNIYDNNGNILLEIEYSKNYYIPLNSNYIKRVNLENKEIETESIKDLIL